MNLFREYLRWYQSPTWLVYAARNQNLSVPPETSNFAVPHITPDASREHSAPAGRAFWEWLDKTQ